MTSRTSSFTSLSFACNAGCLLLMLLVGNKALAQFPSPYCSVDFSSNVEPITLVQFAGINNSSSASVGSGPSLQNFLNVSGTVDPGSSYPITLKGNTDGGFDNYFSVFIDWNQDNEFDGPGESYEIEDPIENSTGTDSKKATGTIAVPAWALPGNTRMRVVKDYSYGEYGTACSSDANDYGQAEDYSLVVTGEIAGFSSLDVLGPIVEGASLALSFADLLDGSNAQAESEQPIVGFRVTSVVSGSLSIDGAPFDAGSNNSITPDRPAVWTSAFGSAGSAIAAFALVAVDEEDGESAPPVMARVDITSLFSHGNGTEGSPWQIASLEQLGAIRHYPTAHFVLTANLDLGGDSESSPFWNEGAGWEPVGTLDVPFTGSFDGGGHALNGLFINRPAMEYVGFFGLTEGASIQGTGLVDVDVTGGDTTGGLVGQLHDESSITDSYVSGSVTGGDWTGGLAGMSTQYSSVSDSHVDGQVNGESDTGGLIGSSIGGSVSNSHASSSVTGSGYTGGLVGTSLGGSISNSYATGDVAATSYYVYYVGGLAGLNQNGTVDRSHSSGSVSGSGYVGGLVGSNYSNDSDTIVRNSYATGNVEGDWSTGGLVGENRVYGGTKSQVINSYAIGHVSGGETAEDNGGLVGDQGGSGSSVSASFWNTETSGQDTSAGGAGAMGRNTEQMQVQATYNGWNFPTIWAIHPLLNGGYPYLHWQIFELPNSPPSVIIPIGEQVRAQGSAFSLDVSGHFSDPGDALIFSAEDLPAGLSISTAGLISGTLAASGIRTVTVTATDSADAFVQHSFTLLVFAGGDGGSATAWQIDKPALLDAIRQDLTGHYVLTAAISLPADWESIGTEAAPFTGSFDGGGHAISGLAITVEDDEHEYAGLFGYAEGADFSNVSLVDVNVEGAYYVGGLVGYLENGSISDSHVSGSVGGLESVGGLAGLMYGGSIENSHASGSVNAYGNVGGLVGWLADAGHVSGSSTDSNVGGVEGADAGFVGGLVGVVMAGSIENSHAAGSVAGAQAVGGLVGVMMMGDIDASYATASVEGVDSAIGGLVGLLNEGSVNDTYATGSVTGGIDDGDGSGVGGLVGALNAGSITNSYAVGAVAGHEKVGALVGETTDSIDGSFWNSGIFAIGIGSVFGSPAIDASGLPGGSLQSRATFEGAGWDFDDIWAIHPLFNGGYPYLQWQAPAIANGAPVVASPIGNQGGMQDGAFALDVSGSFDDPDGDTLTFTASGLPASLSISAEGVISGTPVTAGSSTVTVTATDPDDAFASDSFTLTVTAVVSPPPPPPPPEPEPEQPPEPEAPSEPEPPGPTVIDTSTNDGTLSGNILITANGVVDGGTIDGQVDNRGTITGDVQLGGGARIDGGTVSGKVSGDAERPALITNADIPAGTRLENVVIGAGTILDSGVQIGANVRFESDDAIPAAIDLTGALRQLQWAGKDSRPVPDLDDDVVTDAVISLIRSIQLLPEFAPADVSQDARNGEIVIITSDMRSAVLPVQVSQAGADEAEGIYFNEDGDVVFITSNRRTVLSYPVLVESSVLVDTLLSLGLQVAYDDRANLLATPAAESAQALLDPEGNIRRASALVSADIYYSGRPAIGAMPAFRYGEVGLYYDTVPGLLNATGLVFVFNDADGNLLEQELVPVPADWFALKEALWKIPGISDVRIDTQGIISVSFNGEPIRGRVSFDVIRTDVPAADPAADVVLSPAGDVNGDGTGDYELRYPNGDRQYLLVYPSP